VELPLGVGEEHVEPHTATGIELERPPLVAGQNNLIQVHVTDIHVHMAMVGVVA